MKRLRLVGANWYPYPGRACDECGVQQKVLNVTDSGRTICHGCCALLDTTSREQKP